MSQLIEQIPIVSVSYNSAELIDTLLGSLRQHYTNPVTIIDGSSAEHWLAIKAVCDRYANVQAIHFDYNIHHGPGMAWAFQNLPQQEGPVLVLDSDVEVLRRGMLEALMPALQTGMYGVGYVRSVDEEGFDIDYRPGAVRYLYPACMLCNIDVVRAWPMPTKHGAPMIAPMLALHRAGAHELIGHLDWVQEDLTPEIETKNYLRHDWQGTVKRTGGYHLEEWMMERLAAQQQQAQPVEQLGNYNHDLLRLMPATAKQVVEVGCNNGAFAQAYKKINPSCHYTGIDISPELLASAGRFCDRVLQADIETAPPAFWEQFANADVWVFGDVLEHLRDPWTVLARIRENLPAGGCVVVSLPNAQHWSVQLKLSIGDLRYEDAGLLDRTHLRFFTRVTMLEMFAGAGLRVEAGFPRVFGEIPPSVATAIKAVAASIGADPDQALQDSLPLQYVVRVVPQSVV